MTGLASVFLARDHSVVGSYVVRSAGPSAAVAMGPGSGPSRNRKVHPNEDSLAVCGTARGLFAAVADAHFGREASEQAMEVFARVAPGLDPRDPDAWQGLVLAVDAAIRALGPASRSATTFLAAALTGRALSWISVGDSYLFRFREGHPPAQLSRSTGFFLGAVDLGRLRELDATTRSAMLDLGAGVMEPRDRLVLATDGILTEDSGLAWSEIDALVRSGDTLEAGLEALFARATRPPGGRDNLAVVALRVDGD